MPLELVGFSEGLRALFTLEFSLFVVLVEFVFVKIEAGGELHRTHPAVEISHLVDLLNMAPELGLKKRTAFFSVAKFHRHYKAGRKNQWSLLFFNKYIKGTRGHWTAMLALIKVDEIAQNLKHF